jgi:pimeloyl-ACP methyl ester carboxylesterase
MSNDRGRADGEGSEESGTEAGERSGLREHLRSRRGFLAGTAGVSGLALGGSAFASGGGTEAGDAGGDDGDEDSEDDSGEGDGEREDEEREYAWKPTAYDITSADGLRLRVWKEVQGTPIEAVLFVHGATYGGVSMFDPPVDEDWDGWMDYAANANQAAYAVDIRGYGDSERPPEFEKTPEESDPVVPAAVAARDVRDTIEWIRSEQGYDRVHLVGLSSGTWRVRALFSEYDPEVASVTLAAGSYQQFEAPTEDLPAWSTQEKSEFVERWRAQVPEEADPDTWIGGERYTAEEVIDAVWEGIYRSGQGLEDASEGESEGGDDGEQTILNPTNLLQDAEHDPGAITAPTLVIRGSSDPLISREGALALYDALDIEEHRKEYAEIAGGTHFLFLEDRRLAMYDAVRGFQRR